MTRTVTITFDDGGQHVYNNVPDDVTPDAIEQRASYDFRGKKLTGIDGGNSRADTIPGVLPRQAPKPTSLLDKAIGAGEAGLSLATGAIGGGIGLAAGALGGIAGGIDTAIRGGVQPVGGINDVALEQAQRFTYQPRTAAGQEQLAAAAPVMANLGAIPPAHAISAAAMAPAVGRQVAAAAPRAIEAAIPRAEFNALRAPFVKDEPQMPGMGAAMTDVATLRNERAQSLPVPINLTAGRLTRDFDQLRFENETAKGKLGEPLRQRTAEINDRTIRNFDAFIDDIGGQAPDLRTTGQVVTNVLLDKKAKKKQKIEAEYKTAREQGDMAEQVDITPLIDFAETNKAEAVNAGIIPAVSGTVERLSTPEKRDVFGKDLPRMMTINDIEEVRKMVNRTARTGEGQNPHFGGELIKIIDKITDGKGGEHYKYARRMHSDYVKEFRNVGVIDKLLRTKPGTTDRTVAYEDVFKHTMLDGSLDDTRMVRKTLQTAGPSGEQAWRELQGQAMQYLKDEATKNAQRDIRGNPIVSFSGLDKAVRKLDADGKLDFVFGQKGAQQIRDLREFSADAMTVPPGSVNTSNTASVIMAALDAIGMFHGIPAPVATIAHQGVKALKTRRTRQQVEAALNPFPENPEQPVTGLAQLLNRQ